jgi:putative spermidine/putrescine transport system ATP-binding protein
LHVCVPEKQTLSTIQPFIRCKSVSKFFGIHKAVEDLSLDIGAGEFVSLLGPSGSGKTTLLMMIAGFETPTDGSIWVGGRQVDRLPPYQRDMGVVFQNYALFPHLTAGKNIAFPLEMRGHKREDIETKVQRALEMVELGHLKDRRPSQLSGGQQQRVALARALVFEPRVVLMDEPLGALDKRLREQMQLDIRELHRKLGLTVVFVTHDQDEALTMSDRIAVFNNGRIEQIGTPRDVYDKPQTRFIAEFIGETNFFDGVVSRVSGTEVEIRCADGSSAHVRSIDEFALGDRVLLTIRPEKISLGARAGTVNCFSSRIVDSVYFGDRVRVELSGLCGAKRVIARSSHLKAEHEVGTELSVSFAPEDCWIIPQ